MIVEKYATGKKIKYVYTLYLTTENSWIYWETKLKDNRKHKTIDTLIVGRKGSRTNL